MLLRKMVVPVMLIALICVVWADPPVKLQYQGKITSSDVALNGTYDMDFKLWTGGCGTGSCIWTEEHDGVTAPLVTVTNGLFDVLLGDGVAFPEVSTTFNQPLWLQIIVEGVTMDPCEAFNPVPYAMYAISSPGGGSGDNIENQYTAQQEGPGFWTEGDGRIDGGNLFIDSPTNPGRSYEIVCAARQDITAQNDLVTKVGGNVEFWLGTTTTNDQLNICDESGTKFLVAHGDVQRVGIGIAETAPSAKLHVNGTGLYEGNLTIQKADPCLVLDESGDGGSMFTIASANDRIEMWPPTGWADRFMYFQEASTDNGLIYFNYNASAGVRSNAGAMEYKDAADGGWTSFDALSGGSSNWVDEGTYLHPLGDGGETVRIYDNGTGKIDCAKVDPVIQIGNDQYATYNWDGIGIRTDIVGVGQLRNGVFELNLAQQPENSDMWLFHNVVAESTIVPFVTPQDEAYLMARMDGSTLFVKAISGQQDARFSYRLSAKRIDMVGTFEEISRRLDNPGAHIKVEDFDKNGGKLK